MASQPVSPLAPNQKPKRPRTNLQAFKFGAPQRNQSVFFNPQSTAITNPLSTVPRPAAGEFTPELNQAVLDRLQRDIGERSAQQAASARGEAVKRGLTGGSFEGRRVGAVEAQAGKDLSDAALGLAIENAQRQRQERLLSEQREFGLGAEERGRAFQAEQAQLQREEGDIGRRFELQKTELQQELFLDRIQFQQEFNALEAEKQRAFQAGENEKARQIQIQQNAIQRDFTAEQNKKQRKADLFGGAVEAGTSVLGSVVGGPIGAAICFDGFTEIEMANGGKQPIASIKLGDATKGGIVVSVKASLSDDRYEYKGVIVTGSHAVKENGVWIRVKNSKEAKKFNDQLGTVYSLITTKHRIYSNGMEFADEVETNKFEYLTIDESLAELNKEDKPIKLVEVK